MYKCHGVNSRDLAKLSNVYVCTYPPQHSSAGVTILNSQKFFITYKNRIFKILAIKNRILKPGKQKLYFQMLGKQKLKKW